jgi:hypothetical protein
MASREIALRKHFKLPEGLIQRSGKKVKAPAKKRAVVRPTLKAKRSAKL